MADPDESLALLLSMGFSKEQCEKALKATGSQGTQAALEWYRVQRIPFFLLIISKVDFEIVILYFQVIVPRIVFRCSISPRFQ